MSSPATYVGIGEKVVSKDPEVILNALHLGSCLGIAMYDRKAKVGGLIHCLLPLAKTDPAKAKVKPYTFVDSGVNLLLQELKAHGAQRDSLKIIVAGGAQIKDVNGVFAIGKKNYTALRKTLWKHSLLITAEHIGGNFSRTLRLKIENGETSVKCNGKTILLLPGQH